MSTVKISPSILSADWTKLGEQVELANRGADWLHLDVMDAHFVPNLTFGPFVVQAIADLATIPVDVHLMVQDPLRYLDVLRSAGVEWITVHAEAEGVAGPGWVAPVRSEGEAGLSGSGPARPTEHSIDVERLRETVRTIRESGVRGGIAIRPDTAVAELLPLLGEIDILLVMSVYPGFSGQPFLTESLEQIRFADHWRKKHDGKYLIEVDGGITKETIGDVARAGADVFVAGHGIYRQPDPLQAMSELREAAERARTVAPS